MPVANANREFHSRRRHRRERHERCLSILIVLLRLILKIIVHVLPCLIVSKVHQLKYQLQWAKTLPCSRCSLRQSKIFLVAVKLDAIDSSCNHGPLDIGQEQDDDMLFITFAGVTNQFRNATIDVNRNDGDWSLWPQIGHLPDKLFA